MIAAFKLIEESPFNYEVIREEMHSDEIEFFDGANKEVLDENAMEDYEYDDTRNEEILEGLTSWDHSNLARNGCLAHLLQLAIKDGIKSTTLVPKLVKKVNDIVTFFSKSCMWKEGLKKKTNDLVLVKPIEVRWNSTYSCFQITLREEKGVSTTILISRP